jgi:hypothetical protein
VAALFKAQETAWRVTTPNRLPISVSVTPGGPELGYLASVHLVMHRVETTTPVEA